MGEMDMTDDWMNPKPMSWTLPAERDPYKTRYVILRERRVQGPLTEWREWSEHPTAEERDAELKRLQAQHPMWSLKSHNRIPAMERTIAIL